jgi:hypothetical protein
MKTNDNENLFDDERDHESEEDPIYYENEDEIDFSILTMQWQKLVLFDDVFLNMQGMNVGIVDNIITKHEYALLREYIEIEKTPLGSAMLVSALSQMWTFALYEVLRLWRGRGHNLKKWFNNGGIESKIQHLKSTEGIEEVNIARMIRISQLEQYRDEPEMRETLERQRGIINHAFEVIELYRVNLAKHSTPGKDNMFPRAPGYGRINMLCGSMDYELADKKGDYYRVNRRDIADFLRAAFEHL